MVGVDIVLSTYNGARYLEHQVRSIVAQTYGQWHLYIRDDSSTDGTLNLIEKLASSESRIEWVGDEQGNLGVIGNFNCLLEQTKSDYVFLCDQDDIWNADKIALSLKCMQELEGVYGQDAPILVHTDLVMVDQSLHVISDSFFDFRNLNSQSSDLGALLSQNIVTGCTVVVNRALLRKALPIPRAAAMHDSWLALVAAAFGHIGFVDHSTMLYRQHEANTLGAEGWSGKFVLSRMKKFGSRRYTSIFLLPLIQQAAVFYQRYQQELPTNLAFVTASFSRLNKLGGLQRVFEAAKMGLKKHGWQRSLGFYWALLIARFD